MPILGSSTFPTPKSWDEFEEIITSAAKIRWESTNFFRNGRPGQEQNGVDVYGKDGSGKTIGIQGKNTVLEITERAIRTEIEKAEKFKPELNALYIATTQPRDSNLQERVRAISDERNLSRKFDVFVLFWEDLFQDLSRNEDVLFGHYPQFRPRIIRNDPGPLRNMIKINAYRKSIIRLPLTSKTFFAIGLICIITLAGMAIAMFSIKSGQYPAMSIQFPLITFLFIVGSICGPIGAALTFRTRSIGIPLLGNIEADSNGRIYLTRLRADCPFCDGTMSMFHAGKGKQDHRFLCNKSNQHELIFDMTSIVNVGEDYKKNHGD